MFSFLFRAVPYLMLIFGGLTVLVSTPFIFQRDGCDEFIPENLMGLRVAGSILNNKADM